MNKLSEREKIIKELKSLYDDGFYHIPWDKIADWHLAKVARIVEPLVKLKVCDDELRNIVNLVNAVNLVLANIPIETLKRAGGE